MEGLHVSMSSVKNGNGGSALAKEAQQSAMAALEARMEQLTVTMAAIG